MSQDLEQQSAFDVESGQTLMQALLELGLPVASSCGGKGVCGKCRVSIAGRPNSTPLLKPDPLEQRLIEKYALDSTERISCQIVLKGGEDLEVDTDYW